MPAAPRAKPAPKKTAVKAPAKATAKKTLPVSGPQVGERAPAFKLPSLEGTVALADYQGKPLILYFYPKDDTSGCTAEACAFSESLPKFAKANGAAILGVSKDDLKSHEKFAKKYKIAFNLASDEDTRVMQAYGVWIEKSMYGRKYMGTDRSTFLIDSTGKIAAVWRKVSVPGHAEDVLKALKEL